MVREATADDLPALRELGDICFPTDPPEFLDWVFRERVNREYIVVAEREGRVAAAVHALMQRIRVRDTVLPGALIGFVGTLPEYRCQGLMHEAMRGMMATMRRRGVAVTVNRPEVLSTYYKLGQYPVAEAKFVELAPAVPRRKPEGNIESVDLTAAPNALFKCYEEFAARYSVITARSWPDYMLKISDYLSCGAKCIAVMGKNGVDGYCIYFDGETVEGEELAALSDAAYEALCAAMAVRAGKKPLRLKLAPDAPVTLPGAAIEIPVRSVMGVADVSKLLPAAGFSRFAVEVRDPAVPENNGTFLMTGERTDDPPQLKLEAGRLAQWITGYKSLCELEEEGHAKLLDSDACERLGKLPKHPCWIIDEY